MGAVQSKTLPGLLQDHLTKEMPIDVSLAEDAPILALHTENPKNPIVQSAVTPNTTSSFRPYAPKKVHIDQDGTEGETAVVAQSGDEPCEISSFQPGMPRGLPGAFYPTNTLDAPPSTAKLSHHIRDTRPHRSIRPSRTSAARTSTDAPTITLGSPHTEGPARKKFKISPNVTSSRPFDRPQNCTEVLEKSTIPSGSPEVLVIVDAPQSKHEQTEMNVFGSQKESQNVNRLTNPNTRRAPRPRIGVLSDGQVEERVYHAKTVQLCNGIQDARRHADQITLRPDVDQIEDPLAADQPSNVTAKRRNIPRKNELVVQSSSEVDRDLSDSRAQPHNEYEMVHGKHRLRDEFLRESHYDGDTDELQQHSLTPAGAKLWDKHLGAKASRTPTSPHVTRNEHDTAKPMQPDLPEADIKPARFTSSQRPNRKARAEAAPTGVKNYALTMYRSATNNRTNESSLRVQVSDDTLGVWKVLTTATTLQIMAKNFTRAFYSDMNGRRIHIQERMHEGCLPQWHHFVFHDAITALTFRRHAMSEFSTGTKIQYKDDLYLERILKTAQNQLKESPTHPAKRSGYPSLHENESQKGPQLPRSALRQPARSESTKKIRDSMRADHIADQKVRYESYPGNRDNDDDIIYERSPSPKATGTVPQTKTQAARRSETLQNAKQQRRRQSPQKYSEVTGLGNAWENSLVFPREGINRATVDFDDLCKLDHGELLNDNIVAFCLQYARQLSLKESERVHIFNTFFYERLTSNVSKGQKINYEAVKRWTLKAKIFEGGCDHIIVPINESYHWYVAIICNIPNLSRTHKYDGSDDQSPSKAAREPRFTSSGMDGATTDKQEAAEVARAQPPESGSELAQETDMMSLDDEAAVKRSPTPQDHSRPIAYKHENPVSPINDENQHDRTKRKVTEVMTKPGEGDTIEKDSKRAKRKSHGGKGKRDASEPVIIVMDSLGGSHPGLTRNLKDWLKAEAKDKISTEIAEPQGSFEKVPGQTNFSDCGVYLAGYVARFLEDPEAFLAKAGHGEISSKAEWAELDADRMRHNMRDVIMNEYATHTKELPLKGRNKIREEYHPPSPRPAGKTAYQQFTAPRQADDEKEEADSISSLVNEPLNVQDGLSRAVNSLPPSPSEKKRRGPRSSTDREESPATHMPQPPSPARPLHGFGKLSANGRRPSATDRHSRSGTDTRQYGVDSFYENESSPAQAEVAHAAIPETPPQTQGSEANRPLTDSIAHNSHKRSSGEVQGTGLFTEGWYNDLAYAAATENIADTQNLPSTPPPHQRAQRELLEDKMLSSSASEGNVTPKPRIQAASNLRSPEKANFELSQESQAEVKEISSFFVSPLKRARPFADKFDKRPTAHEFKPNRAPFPSTELRDDPPPSRQGGPLEDRAKFSHAEDEEVKYEGTVPRVGMGAGRDLGSARQSRPWSEAEKETFMRTDEFAKAAAARHATEMRATPRPVSRGKHI